MYKMIISEKNLATRESARNLFEILKKKEISILDFHKVEVVSRSFANEFIKLEQENKIYIEKVNMSEEVKFMFNVANKILDSDILSKNKYSTISLKEYESMI